MLIGGLFNCICSAEDTTVTAMDLAIEIEGFSILETRFGPAIRTYNYSNYSSFLEDIGVYPFDYLLGAPPKEIVTLSYYNETGDFYSINLEIHVYESEEAAENEYELQKNETEWSSTMKEWEQCHGPMFHRFDAFDRIFQHGPFLIYFYCDTWYGWGAEEVMDALIVKFLENFFKLFTEIPQPPPVNFTGKVVWGIQPGDKITWRCTTGGFAGYEPYSESSGATWEIIQITDDNLAVLIKKKVSCPYLLGKHGWKHYSCGVVYDIYVWKTVDEGGLLTGVSGCGVEPAIYPVYMEGYTLRDRVESEIDYLPESNVVENETYISGYGKTEKPMGYTPVETQQKDVTIHKGTGIITSGSYYYKNIDMSIETTSTVTVVTSFDLESRVPYVPPEDGDIGDGDGSTPQTNGDTDDGNGSTPLTPQTNGEPDETSQADSSTFLISPLLLAGAAVAVVVIIVVVVVAVVLLKKKK